MEIILVLKLFFIGMFIFGILYGFFRRGPESYLAKFRDAIWIGLGLGVIANIILYIFVYSYIGDFLGIATFLGVAGFLLIVISVLIVAIVFIAGMFIGDLLEFLRKRLS
jgi:hypothetical protein